MAKWIQTVGGVSQTPLNMTTMPSTRSRAQTDPASQSGVSVSSNTRGHVDDTDDPDARPAKRLRTQEPESGIVNKRDVQEDSGASEHVDEAEDDTVIEESKDPSRAADLYLDTVCVVIVHRNEYLHWCTGQSGRSGF